MAIKLTGDWNLHGAADLAQLNTILNALGAAAWRDEVSYDAIAGQLGIPRGTVAEVARWYQSLWLR